jgi:3-carboxy-cis,cis-muconate cycloisomerase
VTAGSQTTELLAGLHVDTGRMAAAAKQRSSALLAEQRSISTLLEPDGERLRAVDVDPASYLGATGAFIDSILARARHDQETS